MNWPAAGLQSVGHWREWISCLPTITAIHVNTAIHATLRSTYQSGSVCNGYRAHPRFARRILRASRSSAGRRRISTLIASCHPLPFHAIRVPHVICVSSGPSTHAPPYNGTHKGSSACQNGDHEDPMNWSLQDPQSEDDEPADPNSDLNQCVVPLVPVVSLAVPDEWKANQNSGDSEQNDECNEYAGVTHGPVVTLTTPLGPPYPRRCHSTPPRPHTRGPPHPEPLPKGEGDND